MRKTWIVGACAALAGCGGEGAAAGPAVRDSAGIQIVQNAGPAWGRGEGWRISAEPLLQVGVAEGDPRYQFASVSDALRLADGTLVVADAQANELRTFDGAGRWVRTLGKKGGGPGEFRGLWSLFLLPGDTVAAHDYQAGRLTLFAPGGAVARTVTLGPLDGALPPRPLGVFGDGSLLVGPMFNPSFRQSTRPSRDTTTLARYSAAGAQVAAIGRMAGEESLTLVSTGEDQIAMRRAVPFGLNTFVAVSGTRVLVGDNARYELAELRPDGRLTRLVRRDLPPEPVTDADRAAYLARSRPPAGDRFRQAHERMLAAITFPQHKSWFQGLRLDPEGNAWVQRHAPPGADTPWDVFDPTGRFLGAVPIPAGLQVMQIGADFVVGVWQDDMDVPHVRVHHIEKSSR